MNRLLYLVQILYVSCLLIASSFAQTSGGKKTPLPQGGIERPPQSQPTATPFRFTQQFIVADQASPGYSPAVGIGLVQIGFQRSTGEIDFDLDNLIYSALSPDGVLEATLPITDKPLVARVCVIPPTLWEANAFPVYIDLINLGVVGSVTTGMGEQGVISGETVILSRSQKLKANAGGLVGANLQSFRNPTLANQFVMVGTIDRTTCRYWSPESASARSVPVGGYALYSPFPLYELEIRSTGEYFGVGEVSEFDFFAIFDADSGVEVANGSIASDGSPTMAEFSVPARNLNVVLFKDSQESAPDSSATTKSQPTEQCPAQPKKCMLTEEFCKITYKMVSNPALSCTATEDGFGYEPPPQDGSSVTIYVVDLWEHGFSEEEINENGWSINVEGLSIPGLPISGNGNYTHSSKHTSMIFGSNGGISGHSETIPKGKVRTRKEKYLECEWECGHCVPYNPTLTCFDGEDTYLGADHLTTIRVFKSLKFLGYENVNCSEFVPGASTSSNYCE